ncbi:MAG: hypothetical protein DLM55_04305 [Acidimicrobiales bacterium]|nr:MAG: hypothetical protein DLM55_04305 [Acidimicrobiales bacterium]
MRCVMAISKVGSRAVTGGWQTLLCSDRSNLPAELDHSRAINEGPLVRGDTVKAAHVSVTVHTAYSARPVGAPTLWHR